LAEKQKFLTYKGRPLVRNGNTLYYGHMYEPYVAMLTITSTKSSTELDSVLDGAPAMDMADKVTIQIMSTDPMASPQDLVVKRGEKNGLYPAMDMASIWLDRYLKQK